MKKRMSITLALVLVFALCLSFVPAAAATADSGAEEVIYARLDATGAVESAYAVVALNGSAGEEASHYGEYTEVENLTDTSPITYEDGLVTATLPQSGRMYYQGTLEGVELPWNIALSYSLDGRAVEPAELGGASGELEMNIEVTANGAAPGDFASSHMLQITVTLDAALCANIEAEGATVANSGGDKALAFTVLPGSEASYTVRADVTDFEMAGLTIAGVEYDVASAMGDMSEITDGVGQITDAISELNSGAAQLASGAGSLASGASQFGSGLSGLSAGSEQIVSGSEQISAALGQITAALSGQEAAGGSLDLSALAQLPAGLEQAASGLEEVASGLSQLAEGYAAAYPALEQAVEAIPEASVSEEDIGALMALAPDNAALAALVQNYQAAQTVKAVWGQTSAAFEAVQDNLPTLAGAVSTVAGSLNQTAEQISAALTATGGEVDLSGLLTLASGLSELAENYAAFHEGLVSYTSGVDTLAANWSGVYSGISGLSGGLSELSGGVSALDAETSQIPELIDSLTGGAEEDEASGEERGSFLDERNTDTASVQFVIMTEGISAPEEPEEAPAAEEDRGFFAELWDKFLALFE